MKTNFTTLDHGRISIGRYARLIKVYPEQGDTPDYVVAVYKDSGKTDQGPFYYISQMSRVEHFTDEQEATQYFLALMDPEEFGSPKMLLSTLKSRVVSKSFEWTPNEDVAKAVEAESFRREVAR